MRVLFQKKHSIKIFLMGSMNVISSIFHYILMSEEISLILLFCQQFDFKHIGQLEFTQGQYWMCLLCCSWRQNTEQGRRLT